MQRVVSPALDAESERLGNRFHDGRFTGAVLAHEDREWREVEAVVE